MRIKLWLLTNFPVSRKNKGSLAAEPPWYETRWIYTLHFDQSSTLNVTVVSVAPLQNYSRT